MLPGPASGRSRRDGANPGKAGVEVKNALQQHELRRPNAGAPRRTEPISDRAGAAPSTRRDRAQQQGGTSPGVAVGDRAHRDGANPGGMAVETDNSLTYCKLRPVSGAAPRRTEPISTRVEPAPASGWPGARGRAPASLRPFRNEAIRAIRSVAPILLTEVAEVDQPLLDDRLVLGVEVEGRGVGARPCGRARRPIGSCGRRARRAAGPGCGRGSAGRAGPGPSAPRRGGSPSSDRPGGDAGGRRARRSPRAGGCRGGSGRRRPGAIGGELGPDPVAAVGEGEQVGIAELGGVEPS